VTRSRWHRLLEHPAIYDLTQRICGAGGGRLGRVYRELFRDSSGTVLDVGCGPTPDTPAPAGTLVGLDVNRRYVGQYVRAKGARAPGLELRGVVASASALPFAEGSFDECRSAATLHHLPDDLVVRAVREMYRTLRPGGRLVIFDMVRPPSAAASPVGWLLSRLDRGQWVRPERELVSLANLARPGDWSVRSFWYTWARLRGCVLCLTKSPGPRISGGSPASDRSEW